VIFGAALLGPVLDQLSWTILAYAVGSLTVVRMLPVMLSMVGSGTLWETRLFFAWFGPRGLASILFALLVVEELGDGSGQILFAVACWTVAGSIFLHGLTASAWAGHLAARFGGEGASGPEMAPVPELPTRRGLSVGARKVKRRHG
jgi:NhaP-type Na+/H+ or K+/H+ antiporter